MSPHGPGAPQHVALLAPPVAGHLHPIVALGRALQGRGHTVTLLGYPDLAPWAARAGLGFAAYGATFMPPGSLAATVAAFARLTGTRANVHTMRRGIAECHVHVAELPPLLRTLGVTGLVGDKASPAAATVATLAGVPLASTMGSLIPDLTPHVPPIAFAARHARGPLARLRNRALNQIMRVGTAPLLRHLNELRRAHGLAPHPMSADWLSTRLALCPIPPEFELPGAKTARYAYVGPLVDEAGRGARAFPWERLTGKPLVYASLGTLHNGDPVLVARLAEALATLDVDAVLALGRAGATPPPGLPPCILVVDEAPQVALLARARLAVTHAGLNTTMEALATGVPLVALPLANDQPGIAERIRYHGVGLLTSAATLRSGGLASVLARALADEALAPRARAMAEAIRGAGGASAAAALVERALATPLEPAAGRSPQ